MPGFDADGFDDDLEDDDKIAHDKVMQKLKTELEQLKGLTDEQIIEFGGTTEDMIEIIAIVENATKQNSDQANIINNIKGLSESAVSLAKNVISFMK